MILYFTGTGNSLAIARKMAERLEEPVSALCQTIGLDLTGEKRIGFVFPVYDFNLPPAVRKIIPQLKLNPDSYVFAIVSCGAQAGNCIWSLRRLLRENGIELAYGNKIPGPDNSAIIFGRNPNGQVGKLERYVGLLDRIISDVQAGNRELHFSECNPFAWVMGRPGVEKMMLRSLRPKVNPDKCIGCGICSSVCPVRNITMTESNEGRPLASVGPDCTACVACLHFCPHQAIEVGGRPTRKDRQYHNPDVGLKDMSTKPINTIKPNI